LAKSNPSSSSSASPSGAGCSFPPSPPASPSSCGVAIDGTYSVCEHLKRWSGGVTGVATRMQLRTCTQLQGDAHLARTYRCWLRLLLLCCEGPRQGLVRGWSGVGQWVLQENNQKLERTPSSSRCACIHSTVCVHTRANKCARLPHLLLPQVQV